MHPIGKLSDYLGFCPPPLPNFFPREVKVISQDVHDGSERGNRVRSLAEWLWGKWQNWEGLMAINIASIFVL